MTVADRQLIEWYRANPGRSTSWDVATGYLLKRANGGEVSRKLAAECEKTLATMRAERLRDAARAALTRRVA